MKAGFLKRTTFSQAAGFTMIELLVITSLSVILMLATSTLFISFLMGRTKVSAIKQVKDEGQYALNRMEFLIRNAIEVLPNNEYPTGCELDMESFSIRSLDGGITTFFSETDASDDRPKIASNSGVYLTSGSVQLVDGPRFDCTEPSDSTLQHVVIRFTLQRGATEIEQQSFARSDFQTSVSIRSF